MKERVVWKSICMTTSEAAGDPGPEKVGITIKPVSTPVLLGVMIQVREKVVPS